MLYDVMYTGYHDFPVKVLSKGGETLINTDGTRQSQYDTLISINVIEHVQDAFQYLTGIICSCMHACVAHQNAWWNCNPHVSVMWSWQGM